MIFELVQAENLVVNNKHNTVFVSWNYMYMYHSDSCFFIIICIKALFSGKYMYVVLRTSNFCNYQLIVSIQKHFFV